MIIRPIHTSDYEELFYLFRNAQVKKSDAQKLITPKSGFYEYNLSEEAFLARFSESTYSFLLEDRGKIISYIIAYPTTIIPKITGDHPDAVLATLPQSPEQIYLDQLLLREGMQAYYAGRLFNAWNHEIRNNKFTDIFAAIPQKPWKNIASTRTANTYGFKQEYHITDNGIQLGVFHQPMLQIEK